ncbi:MAG TPA: hypothetical protein VIJ33_08590, partial [Solirubrobacteraceae bacterium]
MFASLCAGSPGSVRATDRNHETASHGHLPCARTTAGTDNTDARASIYPGATPQLPGDDAMKQLAEDVYMLKGFPPNAINVYVVGDVL